MGYSVRVTITLFCIPLPSAVLGEPVSRNSKNRISNRAPQNLNHHAFSAPEHQLRLFSFPSFLFCTDDSLSGIWQRHNSERGIDRREARGNFMDSR
ncbi:hypothetical protein DFP72DRAFT_901554, partial [Ephemerocybe angulata]